MSYSKKLKESKAKIHNHAIGTKILDLMDKLRMDSEKGSERRWIWELLQNSKDVADESAGVSCKIELEYSGDGGVLRFSHNGSPFSIDNISFLIEQVSTKDRSAKSGEKPKNSGKFGTGFLTTHLLSEKVGLNGVVKEPELPYRKFELQLDRSGDDIDEVIESINDCSRVLQELDNQPAFEDYREGGFYTEFTYNLDSQGVEIAELGIEDLHRSLPYTLVFLPELTKITLVSQNIYYEVVEEKEIPDLEGLYFITVKKGQPIQDEYIQIAFLTNGTTSISVQFEEIEGQIYLKELNTDAPKLFCDFPLIGTETFHFPVIINSPQFNPTEPRNGVFLTDRVNPKITENKKILKESVELFSSLLDYASRNNWQNLYLLSACYSPEEKKWLSSEWYKINVLMPTRRKIISVPIVDTYDGKRLPIKSQEGKLIDFPHHKEPDIRKGIWKLCSSGNYFRLPIEKDLDSWYETFTWSKKTKLSLEKLTEFIHNQGNIGSLADILDLEEEEAIVWLNEYYDLINKDEEALKLINLDEYAVIPNQIGDFCNKSKLFVDKKIEEELKNVIEFLGNTWRSFLIHKNVRTGVNIKYSAKNQENIVDEINKYIKTSEGKKVEKACDRLVCLYAEDDDFPKSRLSIYHFYKKIFPDDVPERIIISSWSKEIWEESDKLVINWMIQNISDAKSLEGLMESLDFSDLEQTKNWLLDFITFLTDLGLGNKLNLKKSPLLPNQNGDFKIKDDLFLDDGEIGEDLKDISNDLGFDFRNELLDNDVFLELPENRTINSQMVADKIKELIKPKFAEVPRSEENKRIFKNLYLWFTKYPDVAKAIFNDLYTNKHKLYDDEEIAKSMQRAEELNDIMEEYDIDDIKDIRKILEKSKKGDTKRQEITQDILVSLGVTSVKELEEALKDTNISGAYFHTSIPDLSLFRYVKGLIERVKLNVKEFLDNHPDYDCEDWEEVAPTVIAGVTKNEREIHLVLRPSDNGQVILYYGSEQDTLLSPDSELWVENGITSPELVTLGRVIKETGINKFSI